MLKECYSGRPWQMAKPPSHDLDPIANERLTISETLEWCHAGFAAAGVRGEILIVDSSDDGTPELALVAVHGCFKFLDEASGVRTLMRSHSSAPST